MGSVIPLRSSPEDSSTAGYSTPLRRFAEAAFVGREREMHALLSSLEATSAGQGRLVFLNGEAGIGKTRTALEFATVARSQGAHVLIGRGIEETGAPPFWPWVQIVRTYLATHAPDVIHTAMGRCAADIAQVIPEVQEYLPDVLIPSGLAPEHAQFRFFEGVTNFLTNVTMVSPLVLVLDDLHWVDPPSLLLLQFLTRQLTAMRVLVVGTYRDMAFPASHPFRAMLGTVARQPVVSSLLLYGLSEPAVAQFLESTTGIPPTAALVTAVYQRTAGNPFFLTEVLRCLPTEGADTVLYQAQAALAFPVPQRVRDVLCRQLQALSADCQHFLSIAAIVGHDFRLPVVSAVAAHASPPLQRPLLDLLDEALAARLITEVPQSPGHYRFAHAFMRETLYAELPVHMRVHLHQQVGEVLEQRCQPHLEPYLSALATHFFAAAQGGVTSEKAMRYTLQAAAHATACRAYDEAAHYYTQALHLLECHPTDKVSEGDVLLALGDAYRKAGLVPEARETLQRAASGAKTPCRPEHLARTALGGASNTTHLFRQEGDYWTIRYDETVFRLKHVHGLHYIAHLLQHPHQAFHVFDLITLARRSASPPPLPRPSPSPTATPHSIDLGDAGDFLDLQARTAYKQRRQALQAELEKAQHDNDIGRQAIVQLELDMLLQQLAVAVGMGGRSRHAASHAERARVNITNRIRAALAKIAVHSPPLAQYLTMTIKTGLLCSYTPAPHAPIVWQF